LKEDQRRREIIVASKQPKSERKTKAIGKVLWELNLEDRAFIILYVLALIEKSTDP